MTDFKLLAKELEPPQFVDADLDRQIVARGQTEKSKAVLGIVLYLSLGGVIGLLLGFVCGILNLPFLAWYLYGGLIAFICGYGMWQSARLTSAFANRQYDLATRYASSALWWNAICMPFTFFSLQTSFQTYLNLLMAEGRCVELEVISKYGWAYSEKNPQFTDVPKNWILANNLAVAYLCQCRYDEAARILKALVARSTKKFARTYLLSNLAYCQLKLENLEQSEQCVKEVLSLLGGNTESAAGFRAVLIKGMIELERKHLEESERLITQAMTVAKKLKLPLESHGALEECMAKIRLEQGRLDEAELHCRNAIAALESAQNPPYFALSLCFATFAEVLAAQGKEDLSEQFITRARLVREAGIDRESETIGAIKARLTNSRRIYVGTQLIESAKRTPLLERTVV